mgnify:CR=1 FL=1
MRTVRITRAEVIRTYQESVVNLPDDVLTDDDMQMFVEQLEVDEAIDWDDLEAVFSMEGIELEEVTNI